MNVAGMVGQLRHWRRVHPLRVHMSVLLALKLVALIAIYHYFFAPAQRVHVDDARVAERILPAPSPRGVGGH